MFTTGLLGKSGSQYPEGHNEWVPNLLGSGEGARGTPFRSNWQHHNLTGSCQVLYLLIPSPWRERESRAPDGLLRHLRARPDTGSLSIRPRICQHLFHTAVHTDPGLEVSGPPVCRCGWTYSKGHGPCDGSSPGSHTQESPEPFSSSAVGINDDAGGQAGGTLSEMQSSLLLSNPLKQSLTPCYHLAGCEQLVKREKTPSTWPKTPFPGELPGEADKPRVVSTFI